MKFFKYVISDKNTPIIFSDQIIHNEVLLDVVTAGFVRIHYEVDKGKFSAICYGDSSSLNKGSRDGDNQLIENFLNSLL